MGVKLNVLHRGNTSETSLSVEAGRRQAVVALPAEGALSPNIV
jgi:hypothetical protein